MAKIQSILGSARQKNKHTIMNGELKKNDEIILDISDINEDGDGVGKYEGRVFFVRGGVPQDRILAGITAIKKNYGYARIIRVITASEYRQENLTCAAFPKCGGCSLCHIKYPEQLKLKEDRVRNALIRIGRFDINKVQKVLKPIIGTENPYYYRNKAQYPVSQDKEGNILVGFYARRSHRIIESEGCVIGNREDSTIIKSVKSWMMENRILPYDEKTGKGLIRHILIRHSKDETENMVCLVINGNELPHKDKLVGILRKISINITSICVNINKRRDNVILGSTSKCIYGTPYITDAYSIGNSTLTVRISPNSFFQVNHTQMEKLYALVVKYAKLSDKENVWDIYCGIGTITMALALGAKQVIGIEYVPQAIEDAKANAKINHIENVRFYCNNVENLIDMINGSADNEKIFKPDVIVLDPPRSGCHIKVLDTIKKARAKRIVYVSCNPSTLARDLKILCEDEYEIDEITPVDQFCHSGHVETVCLMSRVEGK